MHLRLDHIDLPFTDFCVLALLLGLLYGITAFEAWLTPKGQDAKALSKENRKTAATFAFFGIFSTLLAGVASAADEAGIDFVYLSVPLVFVGHWAWFHYQSSDLIDPQVVTDLLSRSYQDAVIQVVAEHGSNALPVDEIRKLALESSVYLKLLKKGQPVLKLATPIPVHELVGLMIPSVDNTRNLLNSLVDEGRVRLTSDEKYCLAQSDRDA